MSISAPFSPQYGQTQVLTPAAASATVSLTTTKQVRLCNTGSNICYVRIWSSRIDPTTVSASTADFPVPAGVISTITKSELDDKLSHISASGTTLIVTPGEGW